ncbi:vWA domain-containing protein [Ferrimicrobium acidiphilum]|uniref:VWA domain containing CoxE-like protein n=1 Tax=Ferrimicrobium acidiphilum DSM 19497 TaxID=1121877 RepID=A0A0D8FYG1_9ACTN|nr:VWA domain-containing protein [Ferrimicrobium acidiphilum]KJE78059.1 VWA domain containing CoxE-like protein [Ferrimicrobium acidiphilum DSM 19497]MCL5053249.1 VWA domain-containing protein [Gammaproteobacteria bacterium]
MLLTTLLAFVYALRSAGVSLGPSSVIDAASALMTIDLLDRDVVRAALAVTLIKEQSSLTIFNRLFDVFFAAGSHLDSSVEDDDLGAAIRDALLSEDYQRLNELVGQAVERFAGVSPERPVSGVYYAYRTSRALDLDRLRFELLAGLATRQEGEATSVFDDPDFQASQRLKELSQTIDREVLSRIVEARGAAEVARTLGLHLPEDVEIMHASREELRELRRIVTPLAVKLTAKLERRHRARNVGRLDFRATIRRSLSTGGIPLDPITRDDRPMRPEVVLLADVSGSVASFARFTMQLLFALSHELRRLRSFAFIDEVDEVTELLAGDQDIEAALRGVAQSAKVVGLVGHSDYGATFRHFDERYGSAISPSTTVVICGDARSNYHEPEADHFRAFAERAKATYWLNPEPQGYWNTGDSALGHYSPWCSAVVECRTLRQLEHFVEQVL